ncbi:MAG: hypothetical protein JNK79_04135 [Chitinophagaceae bacterium]|nr:hypothetical protein [Chitinophagaceae bacterium]
MRFFSIAGCVFVVVTMVLTACTASKVGSATREEGLAMKISEQHDLIDIEKVPRQEALTMSERLLVKRGESRGPLAPLAGNLVSLASSAVKQMIANDQKKYLASYSFGLNGLYFYDQLASDSHFDPVGMQFNGFRIIRTFQSKSGSTDTALIADFMIDTSSISEIINNSMFRLRLKSFDLRYAKAKVPAVNKEKILNMDIQVSFMTSYVTDDGQLHDSVTLGKFFLALRKAPLDTAASNYTSYYESLKDTLLTGKSFIVPRSFGYHRNALGDMIRSYSQGAYSIQVKVVETSKNNFVTKLVFDNANSIIDAGGNQLKKIGSKL